MRTLQNLRVTGHSLKSAFAIVAALTACMATYWFATRTVEYASEQFLMDTLVTIRVYGTERDHLEQAVTEAFAEMRRVANLADRFPQPGTTAWRESDVCRINDQAGLAPVRVHEEVMAMLALARKGHALSDGGFDATIGPAMDLWGFAGDQPQVPSPEQLTKTMALVGSKNLVVDPREQSVFLRRTGMALDLGAVAKGYATERALRVLEQYAIQQALIDSGGNIRVLGRNARGTSWRIGIKDPRRTDGLVAVLSLDDTSAVTSGDYCRYFEEGGTRWHHILDPRSGYPARENLSVTVITRDAGLADVLSTAFFVLPAEKALAAAKHLPDVDLVVITADGRLLHTPGLRGRIEVLPGTAYRYDQS